jgi:phosphonate transport system substrate-binding protein
VVKEIFVMQKLKVGIGITLFSLVLLVSPATWAKDNLVMTVHPYKPIQELYARFKPIAEHLSRKLGKPVVIQFGKTYEDTVDKVGKGEADFAFLGPSLYVQAHDKYKVVPLAQVVNSGKPSFYGVIVAKKGKGITSLKDLKGKTFAFGDKNSTLTHIVPLYMMMEAGVQLSDLKGHTFVGSHDNVALNVIRETSDAAGLMPDIAQKYVGQGLEAIAKSPDLPEHVFAAARTLDGATVTRLQEALLTMDASLCKGIKDSITGMQKFTDKDFDVLRKVLKKVEKDINK